MKYIHLDKAERKLIEDFEACRNVFEMKNGIEQLFCTGSAKPIKGSD